MTRTRPRFPASSPDSLNNQQILPVPNSTSSYWRSDLHPLDEYRSSDLLPGRCDVAIIGAGMSGVSVAYNVLELCGDGPLPSIVMLEARQVCSGATGRNGGHTKVLTSTVQRFKKDRGVESAEELTQFQIDQMYAMKHVVETEQLACEFELRRSFDIFLDDTEAEEVEKEFFASVRNGERWTREVDFIPKERAEQVTSIKGAKCAFSVPAASLWPYKFVTGLLAKIIDRINLQTNTTVMGVLTKGNGENLIHTSRGSIQAKKVIFASNAYTGGICSIYKDKIIPYKGVNSHLKPHPQPVSPHLSHTYNISYSPGRVDYLNPRPDGGIVVGGGKWNYAQEGPLWYNNWDDSTLLPNVKGHFDGLMQRHFKGWESSGSALDALWTGIMGLTKDELPHVGEVVGKETQYVIAGFNGGGMSLIYLCSVGLAMMVMEDIPFEKTGLPRCFKTTVDRLRD